MFFVTTDDTHAEALNAGVAEALSRAGVSQIVTRETQNAYRAIARLNTIDRQGNGLTARLALSLLAPNGNIVWSQTVPRALLATHKNPKLPSLIGPLQALCAI